ncbi:MAG: protease-like activity factor CPAF [Oligoflexales bacterium]
MKKFAIGIALLGSSLALSNDQEAMLRNADTIQNIVTTLYAPLEWKKNYGFELEQKIADLKTAVTANPQMSTRQYQEEVSKFFLSMKDYHVSVSFISTESATLPLEVKRAQDRFFLVYVDRNQLPKDSYPFEVGDELVSFGGRPPLEVVSEIEASLGQNTKATDEALATMLLTRRSRARMPMDVPHGTINLVFKRGEQAIARQLIWDYKPESVVNPTVSRPFVARARTAADFAAKLTNTQMVSPLAEYLSESNVADDNPHRLGAKVDFVPSLGKKLWKNPGDGQFDAYIYENAKGKKIGYIRISRYLPENPEAAVIEFANHMAKFQQEVDGLVIDQMNNPGGSIFYLYALASTLTDRPLYAPKHRISITPKDVLEAKNGLSMFEAITDNNMAREALGQTLHGYPVNYQLALFLREFLTFTVDQWEAGKRITDPTHIYAVDQINPYPTAQFTKPILFLINELDFSGGDFMPAILQDNDRITTLGVRTAGAGGYIVGVTYPNYLGIEQFTVTGSIAQRIDANPIENLGVTPDLEYKLTPEDYQNGFAPFASKIKATMDSMLE